MLMKRVRFLIAAGLCLCVVLPSSPSAQTRRPGPIDTLIQTTTSQLEHGQFEAAYQSASQALQMSRSIGDQARDAQAANLLAVASFYTQRVGLAINFFKQASP